VFFDSGDAKISLATGGASVTKEVTETADKYFRSYLQLDGGLLITSLGDTTVKYSYIDDGEIKTDKLTVPQNGTRNLDGNIKLLCLEITTETEEKDGEDIDLPDSQPQLVRLTVIRESEEFRQRFISGDIFYISRNYSVIGTYIRGNSGEKYEKEVNDGLIYRFNGEQVTPEETVLTAERFHDFGLAAVTVESGGITACYEVYLDRPPVTGVNGVTVTMSDGFEASVFDETETITLTLGLFQAQVYASVPSEITVEKAVCRPVNSSLIMELDEDGVEIGVGEYEIYVTGKIVQGYAEETFTQTYPLTVTADGSLKDFSANLSSLTAGKIIRTTLIHSERSGSVYVTATSKNSVTCESCGEGEYDRAINLGGAGGTDYRSIKFCVKAESVITVTLSSQDYAEIIFSGENGIISTKEIDGGGELTTLQFTAPSSGEFYLYSARRAVSFYAAEIEYVTL
ncbi:MAG: hypothetical protein K2O67_01170, partial [Clostridia bacterium]|nr:hypothetical protein [Clostridia bacterium]